MTARQHPGAHSVPSVRRCPSAPRADAGRNYSPTLTGSPAPFLRAALSAQTRRKHCRRVRAPRARRAQPPGSSRAIAHTQQTTPNSSRGVSPADGSPCRYTKTNAPPARKDALGRDVGGKNWRWRRDLNPRLGVTQHSLSRRAPSAARTRHRPIGYRKHRGAHKTRGRTSLLRW